jgi:hypothetical protein
MAVVGRVNAVSPVVCAVLWNVAFTLLCSKVCSTVWTVSKPSFMVMLKEDSLFIIVEFGLCLPAFK